MSRGNSLQASPADGLSASSMLLSLVVGVTAGWTAKIVGISLTGHSRHGVWVGCGWLLLNLRQSSAVALCQQLLLGLKLPPGFALTGVKLLLHNLLLLVEHIGLVGRLNGLVGRLNGLVGRLNGLVGWLKGLVDGLNGLVDKGRERIVQQGAQLGRRLLHRHLPGWGLLHHHLRLQ